MNTMGPKQLLDERFCKKPEILPFLKNSQTWTAIAMPTEVSVAHWGKCYLVCQRCLRLFTRVIQHTFRIKTS